MIRPLLSRRATRRASPPLGPVELCRRSLKAAWLCSPRLFRLRPPVRRQKSFPPGLVPLPATARALAPHGRAPRAPCGPNRPPCSSATAAAARGQSSASFWRTSYTAIFIPSAGGTTISVTISCGLSACSLSLSLEGVTKNFSISSSRAPSGPCSRTFAPRAKSAGA